MKFSTLPPTSGIRTSTVAVNCSREPPLPAGASAAVPVSETGAPGMVAGHRGRRLAVADRGPRLLAHDRQIAGMELRHHAWQSVATQHLGGDHVDTAVAVELHRVQRRLVGAGVGQPLEPIGLIAECPVNLFDAALVLGGHVE